MSEQDVFRKYLKEIGRKGGQSTSPKKQTASRANLARRFRTEKSVMGKQRVAEQKNAQETVYV